MTRSAAVVMCGVAMLAGCGASREAAAPRVVRSPTGPVGAEPVTTDRVANIANAFMRAYLHAEVGHARPRDALVLRRLSAESVGHRATQLPRPTNRGFPPAGVLTGLRLLPTLTAGQWTAEARVRRSRKRECWELHLTSTPHGPVVVAFQATAGGDVP